VTDAVVAHRSSGPIDSERFLDTIGKSDELPSTDDVLARVLPLLEQVHAVHEAHRVAPLDGVEQVRAIAGRLFFASGATREPTRAARAIDHPRDDGAVRVAGRYRRDGSDARVDLSIGDLEQPSERPVFLPRYVTWEHVVGHHDPLTDVFALGMIAASVALDANLGDPDELARFVAHRRSLTALNPRLHPVVARVIADMTELDRRDRSQDLPSLIASLRGYREQKLDLDLGPADEKTTRRTAICRRLRDRLFDFSRRNRLLYFKPTASTVDLTATSVPLVLDVRNIDPASLFTFGGRAAADVLALKPVPLSRYVRFEDYPYAAPALDAVRLEARRSRAELGFSQLRLAVCFLHWHDLKEAPNERINSPLLLLPVELDKKRGVRDAFTLTASDDRAEVNPVLRQYLRQRYSIDLPEHVELGEPDALDRLHAQLVAQIQATEPGVTLEKIDKPRIDLVLAVARKRLDAYRRKVALSGRNVRTLHGLDYAYRGDHVRPLGVQLFHAYVVPRPAPDSVMHDPPRPIVWRAQPDDTITKELYSLKSVADEGGPYRWAFDLTTVTLAHFNYRNVSLVRDYATLIDDDGEANPAFAAVFRDDAKPVEDAPPPLPLPERHEVVLADPTQSAAVARARRGASYVIQGPPGTGKSQTITNLIADHVARGKRVLFVCEKRAALDVVHHRLVQVGIGPLACLIHDAQDDKKEFLKDLKETYEGWLADGATTTARDARDAALARAAALLERGTRLERAMLAAPTGADASLLAILRRAVELREIDATEPDEATLPAHRAVAKALPAIERVESALRALGHAGPLASHPARLIGAALLDRAAAVDVLRDAIAALARDLATIAACAPLVGERAAMADVVARHRLACRVAPLVAAGLGSLLEPSSDAAKAFRTAAALVDERDAALATAAQAARGWRDPFAPDDAERAHALAQKYEAGFFARLFSSTWRQLKRDLIARFDTTSRAVLGSWSDILAALVAQHRAAAALDEARAALASQLANVDPIDARVIVDELQRPDGVPAAARRLRELLVRGGSEARAATEAATDTKSLAEELAAFTAWEHLDPEALRRELAALERDGIALAPLRGPLVELDRAGRDIAALLRRHALDARALEALVSRRAIATALRERAPDLALAEGSVDAFGDELARSTDELRKANARALVELVRSRFVEKAQLAQQPASGLTSAQKEIKRAYAAGRRELEHELGKVMRHKTIREIASGPAGVVVRDIKPIWLMSPLSVADVLPLESAFDLVIFDEASQIPLEDAVPAIHRAPQVIVVGDRQQLPPTNFFAASIEGEDDAADDAFDGLDRELDADSLLTHADRTLPSTLLGWHYRSRHESLIDFSNRAFYAGRLLTIPPVTEVRKRAPIVARAAEDGRAGCELMLDRPISFHRVDGVYESRRNVPEAQYIAHLVRELLAKQTKRTIGVVAFSEAQQGAIEAALDELAAGDADLRARLDEEMAREEDGQFVGLFVKNLENVQGDERDVIVVSVCYGPDPRGKMIMNFGPINRRGGERRLNVIFSRARHHIAVVSTIDHARITNDYNDGAACLKRYLQYAECCSIGDVAGARAALHAGGDAKTRDERDPVVADIARVLRTRGWEVAEGVGSSRLRCDLAIRRADEPRYRLGVLVDSPGHWALGADEALRLKPGVLRAFDWRVTTVLTKDWLADPSAMALELEQLARAD
jgi:hypothetical protein